jgi:tetratricopeptide (TPR) repeat protein
MKTSTSVNITLLIIQEHTEHPICDSFIQKYENHFEHFRIVKKAGSPKIRSAIPVSEWSTEASLTDAINHALNNISTTHIMILYSDEELLDPDITVAEGEWQAARLIRTSDDRHMGRSIRLIPVNRGVESGIFSGTVFPDCCTYLADHGYAEGGGEVVIRKKKPILSKERLQKLIDNDLASTSKDWYLVGVYYSEKQKYHKAEKALRLALTANVMLQPIYRMSAINLLANACAELGQTRAALAAVDQSLDISCKQFAPYLIRHKIMWMQKNWQEASDALNGYLSARHMESDAAYDFTLEPKEAHYLLAELSLKLNKREEAFSNLEELYRLSEGQVSQEVKDKLFVYAVELEYPDRARFYFEEFYMGSISADMPKKLRIRVLGAVSLFEEKGWNQIACEFYEALFERDPGCKEIMRRWIITLMRSDQLSRAQKALQLKMTSAV